MPPITGSGTPTQRSRRLSCPWPVPTDLAPFIAHQDVEWTINSKPPALETNMDPGHANSVAEIMMFEYGTRGFFSNGALGIPGGGSAGGIASFRYILRSHLSHNDAIDGANPDEWSGITHGSFGAGQPFPATLGGTMAIMRVLWGANPVGGFGNPPYPVELLWCPGGGAGFTTFRLSQPAATPPEAAVLLELVVDYPSRQLEGWVNGVMAGRMPMTGWNGSRLPNANEIGKVPWMSIVTASGNDPAAQTWYHAWTGIEMEIDFPTLRGERP